MTQTHTHREVTLSENVHLNDGNAVIRYEGLSHSYHIMVMDRIARRLRGDNTDDEHPVCR